MRNYYRYFNIPNFSPMNIITIAYKNAPDCLTEEQRLERDYIYNYLKENKIFYDTELILQEPVVVPKRQLITQKSEKKQDIMEKSHKKTNYTIIMKDFMLYFVLGAFAFLMLGGFCL